MLIASLLLFAPVFTLSQPRLTLDTAGGDFLDGPKDRLCCALRYTDYGVLTCYTSDDLSGSCLASQHAYVQCLAISQRELMGL